MDDLSVLETSVLEPLAPTFVKTILAAPPFYQIQGVLNVRSIPLPPTSSTRGLVLRSGETNNITPLGKLKLSQELGITKIFDLRSDKERAKFGSDSALNIPDVEIVCVPARTVEPKEDLKTIFGKFGGNGDQGFVDAYRSTLEQGKKAYGRIFEFLRDELHNGNGCLIHCSLGKDRTALAAMLILDLAGVPDEEIMKDYALTRVGAEPVREATVARFAELLQDPEIAESTVNALGCRPSAMRATLNMLREEYGGAAGYLKNHLGFSNDDVGRIVENLTSRRN
ncbi:hypothetical protein M407DRAFT_20470 [Tulasnella calospora MUT 4182]|uniref:Tyrosine specific protein phosphatases domain-containing protein n=1 Tax=Tulasnella calospora MUT 4182 TaxID=1051891 RepID=A0A0C3L9A5_9AGAM|nr:hypothetical protein M407DRAFT_20470 [Tulasnella calospora MUT 4182]